MKDIFFFVYVLQNVFAQQPVCGEIWKISEKFVKSHHQIPAFFVLQRFRWENFPQFCNEFIVDPSRNKIWNKLACDESWGCIEHSS